jgi:small subunit ribosomal protein S4
VSDRGLQLREKQKARWVYGVLERQFRRVFAEAERQPGVTGDALQVLLERRLDNTVYRLGFADSRAQARQLVMHGHFLVNEHLTDVPSYVIKAGDTIGWKPSKEKTEYHKQLIESIKGKSVPGWLSLDRQKLVAKVVSLPTAQDAEAKFQAKAIIEYYSR